MSLEAARSSELACPLPAWRRACRCDQVSPPSEPSQRASRPEAVLLVLDSTNLARHLMLAAPILALGLPTLIILNMADDLRKLLQLAKLCPEGRGIVLFDEARFLRKHWLGRILEARNVGDSRLRFSGRAEVR